MAFGQGRLVVSAEEERRLAEGVAVVSRMVTRVPLDVARLRGDVIALSLDARGRLTLTLLKRRG